MTKAHDWLVNGPALAGKDSWQGGVDLLVGQMYDRTGKAILGLVQQIEEQPAVQGQLSRVMAGLLRHLALLTQENISLRQRLSSQRPAGEEG